MAIQLLKEERDPQKIVDAIRQLVEGRQNSIGDVRLTNGGGVTSTFVSFPNCSKDCRVLLFPQNAAAAAVVATTYVAPADIDQGGFTIRHAGGVANRDFTFLCIGG